ncbi:MAG: group 1 glycosyl transferase [uncultured bacterium]|nr:MAG: group 1 glycosyl transferase [uncultured bacterium]
MKIGIDISQLAYENTGVANYLKNLVESLTGVDNKNQYILFYSSLRGKLPNLNIDNPNVYIKKFKIPPTILDLLWNRLHIMPIESFIGDVDIFISSDWTEPPTKRARKATILYDLIVYKYPKESHNQTSFNPFKFIISPNIVAAQKRKLKWVKKESSKILCISEATKKDAIEILGIDEKRLEVISAGI